MIRILFLLLFLPNISFSQGDCPSSATDMTECGFSYTGNNGNFSACGDGQCGGSCSSCGGSKSSTSWDNDCSTSHPNTNCGCDLDASTENNMFWKFSVSNTCDYDVCVTADNCNNSCGGPSACGVQAQVFQKKNGSVTNYLASETGSNVIWNGNTKCFTITADPTQGEIYVMVDGYDGDECDVSVDITPTASCTQCTLPIELKDLSGEKKKEHNLISWTTATETNTDHFIVQRKNDGNSPWEYVNKKKAVGNSSYANNYSAIDTGYSRGNNYYRLIQYDRNGESESFGPIVIKRNEKEEPIKIIDQMGREVSEDHRGLKIYIYSDHIKKKY